MSIAFPETETRQQQILREGGAIVLDLEHLFDEEALCEAEPGGKPCFRAAEYRGYISHHGCKRDGVAILMCSYCHQKFKGGTMCAVCHSDEPIFLVSSVAI